MKKVKKTMKIKHRPVYQPISDSCQWAQRVCCCHRHVVCLPHTPCTDTVAQKRKQEHKDEEDIDTNTSIKVKRAKGDKHKSSVAEETVVEPQHEASAQQNDGKPHKAKKNKKHKKGVPDVVDDEDVEHNNGGAIDQDNAAAEVEEEPADKPDEKKKKKKHKKREQEE